MDGQVLGATEEINTELSAIVTCMKALRAKKRRLVLIREGLTTTYITAEEIRSTRIKIDAIDLELTTIQKALTALSDLSAVGVM